jgi:exodeoxyribonuclease-3
MRIITLNANGIRAAQRKGFFEWLAKQDFDVCCLQELKAKPEQLDEHFYPEGFFTHYYSADKPGYSGVGLIAREKPTQLIEGLGIEEFDREGRYLEARFGDLAVISLYLPSGSSSDHRQASKERFMEAFLPHLKNLRRRKREHVICGDWNIVRSERDIKNWRGNQKNSGCLPHERAWMNALMERYGWVDSYRTLYPEGEDYTWWSNRGRARENNVGWRIDYQLATPKFGARLERYSIYRGERFSDHAPFIADYKR